MQSALGWRTKALRWGTNTPAGECESALSLIRDSLAVNRGQRLAELVIDPLLRQVRTFGFHLSTLDIRQHARLHTQALAEIGAKPVIDASPQEVSAASQDVLDTFREIARLKQE